MLKEKVRQLEEEIRLLREENETQRNEFRITEEENHEFSERYVKVERRNSDLVNLYVASYRLHSTLNYEEVLKIVNEIVINMIGAEVFEVYLMESKGDTMTRIAQEGMKDRSMETFDPRQGVVAEAIKTNQTYVADDLDLAQEQQEPMACVPLKVGDTTMGFIVIYQLLIQKNGFGRLDFDLFELLGGHAATAIYGARMYTTHGGSLSPTF
jgi:GAF domain-containing protein